MIINPKVQSLQGSSDDSELRLKCEEKAFDRAAVPYFRPRGFRIKPNLGGKVKIPPAIISCVALVLGARLDGFRACRHTIIIYDKHDCSLS